MKKQILLLVLFVLAAFANVNKSYGQCDDALHPVAGKSYPYTVTVSPTGGKFEWYVTTDVNLLTGTHVASDAANYLVGGVGYNDPTTTSATINITWTSKAVSEALAGTTKFYLVVKYTTDPACTDNVKAYIITPINLFSIVVENIDATGGTYADICRSTVQSAIVNAAGTGIDFDYGENALYLKVTANYFTTSWTPKIDMAVLNGSLTTPQVVKSMEWSLTTTFTGTGNFDLTTGVATAAVPDKGGDGITSGTDEFVYVKVIITDGKFEGTADQTISLNLSATDASSNPDVDKDASCADITPDPDFVKQILKLRPSVTSATPVTVPAAGTGAFLPAIP